MIIVNNAFSTKMLVEDAKISVNIITEDEFRDGINMADEIIIGHEDAASYFGVEMNRKTVHLNAGDTLYVCEANSRDGGRLPSGTEFLTQMGDGFYFRFLKVVVE